MGYGYAVPAAAGALAGLGIAAAARVALGVLDGRVRSLAVVVMIFTLGKLFVGQQKALVVPSNNGGRIGASVVVAQLVEYRLPQPVATDCTIPAHSGNFCIKGVQIH